MLAALPSTVPVVPLRVSTSEFVEALIDTGSTHSYIAGSVVDKLKFEKVRCPPLSVNLATNGATAAVDHKVEIKFALGPLQASYKFYVLPAAAADVILGTDFQRDFKVVADLEAGIVHVKGVGEVPLVRKAAEKLALAISLPETLTKAQKARLQGILLPLYFASPERPFGRVHKYIHTIDTGQARPIYQPLRRTSPAERAIVQEEVQKMLAAGAIRPSASPWASPLTLVPKKDGTTRVCVDYRRLNEFTVKDRHPLPRVDDMLEAMRGACYFTSLDAASGYWQIPIADRDVSKTAFVCTEGQFEWLVMPFGLCNAPATYQRMMQDILSGFLFQFCVCYLDDILIYSKTFEDHIKHLQAVLRRLEEAGLLLKPSKCDFARREISFLGHILSESGIKTDPAKIEKVKSFPTPTTPTEVRAFLGLANYYRKFIAGFATIAGPLYELTGKGDFNWTEEAQNAFDRLREKLGAEVTLSYPDFSKPFILDCDASETGMGAIVAQCTTAGERPIAMESRKFTTAERKWHIREKEALAIKFGLEKFRHYLLGSDFVVRTDHSSLEWLFKAKTGRLQRWALVLQEYLPFKIQHRAGTAHANVDAFTRIFAESECAEEHMVFALLPSKMDLPSQEELRKAQAKDPGLGAIQKQSHASSRNGILGITEYGRWRPYLPKELLERVLRTLHQHPLGSHFGAQRTRHLLAQVYVCNCTVADVQAILKKCQLCAQRRPAQPHGALRSRVPEHPWHTVAMDFCGPYPISDGCQYVLVFVDQFTKWVELVPTTDQTAITVIQAFYTNVICRHGCPRRLLSDNGPSFRSHLLEALCKNFGIKKIFATAYYPQGDGYAERFMRTLNNSLSALTRHTAEDWTHFVPGVAFGYNITRHAATNISPFELLRGMLPHLPGGGEEDEKTIAGQSYVKRLRSVILNATQRALKSLTTYHEKMKRQYDKKSKEFPIEVDSWVLVKLSDYERDKYPSRKLSPKWSGPRRVTEVSEDSSTCVVRRRDGEAERVNRNRLLPLGQDTWPVENKPIQVETKATTPRRRDSSGSEDWVYVPQGRTRLPTEVPLGQPVGETELLAPEPVRDSPSRSLGGVQVPTSPAVPVTSGSASQGPPSPNSLVRPVAKPPSDSSQDSEEGLYEVAKIVGYRKRDDRFRVRWKGYTAKHDTWQNRESLHRVQGMVNAFEEELTAKAVAQAATRKRSSQRPESSTEVQRKRQRRI